MSREGERGGRIVASPAEKGLDAYLPSIYSSDAFPLNDASLVLSFSFSLAGGNLKWSRGGLPFLPGELGHPECRALGSLVLTVLWLCRLPKKDNPRRGLWLANCQRLDPSGQGLWDPTSEYIYFCSKHFEENCFELVGIRWVFLPANTRTGCEAALCPGEAHELASSQTGRPVVKGAVASFQVCTVKAWSQDHRTSDIREKQPFQAGEIAPFAKVLVCKFRFKYPNKKPRV